MDDFRICNTKELLEDILKTKDEIGKPTQEDYKHIRNLRIVCDTLMVTGIAFLFSASFFITSVLWIIVSVILGSLLLSFGALMKWTIIAHPVLHGAYDNIKDIPNKYKSAYYAKGLRRTVDMPNWVYPPAWITEHNKLHHGNLGTTKDPDTPITKFLWLRNSKMSQKAKYLEILKYASISGFSYYAKETMKAYNKNRDEPASLFEKSILPHLSRILILFVLLSLSGVQGILVAVFSIFLWELSSNLLSFALISATHTGRDVYRFSLPSKSRGETMLRELLGTVNYTTGGDFRDFMNGFLGYHSEHHVLPNETHLFYRKFKPELKKICKKHGIRYIEESTLKRIKDLFLTYSGTYKSQKCKI